MAQSIDHQSDSEIDHEIEERKEKARKHRRVPCSKRYVHPLVSDYFRYAHIHT